MTTKLDFTFAKQEPLVQNNMPKILASTTPKTRDEYLSRFVNIVIKPTDAVLWVLKKQAQVENKPLNVDFYNNSFFTTLEHYITDILERRNTGRLSDNTMKKYCASLIYGLTLVYFLSKDNLEPVIGNTTYYKYDLLQQLSKEHIQKVQNTISFLNIDNIQHYYDVILNIHKHIKVNVQLNLHSFSTVLAETTGDDNQQQTPQIRNKREILDVINKENKKTSTTKAKRIPKRFLEVLSTLNSKDLVVDKRQKRQSLNSVFKTVLFFVILNSELGLRPIEWKDAVFLDASNEKHREEMLKAFCKTPLNALALELCDTGELDLDTLTTLPQYAVKVKNAKRSNGRACGDYRYIALNIPKERFGSYLLLKDTLMAFSCDKKTKAFSDTMFSNLIHERLPKMLCKIREIPKVKRVLNTDFSIKKHRYKQAIKELEQQIPAEDLEKIQNAKTIPFKELSDTARNIILEIAKMPKPMRYYPTLYSTRHQAVANAKASDMNPVEIAAMFGHASIDTNKNHYGQAQHGHSKSKIRPCIENLNIVMDNLNKAQIKKVFEFSESQAKLKQQYKERKENRLNKITNNKATATPVVQNPKL